MESELKELLRDRADEAGTDPTIAPALLRRARSRRRRTVALAGLLTVAVAAGSIVGVRAILDFEPPAKPAAGTWRGIWPQDTRNGAQSAQDRLLSQLSGADPQCDPDMTFEFREIPPDCPEGLWQLSAERVAMRFAYEALGWTEAHVDSAGARTIGSSSTAVEIDPDSPGPVTLRVLPCEGSCKPAITADVTIERLLRKDRNGLWFVTGADQAISPFAAESLVREFLRARTASLPVGDLIAPAAQEVYDQGDAGLSLYGGETGPFVGYEVAERDPAGEDTFLFLVRMSRGEGAVAESLLVGPGNDANGDPKPVVVLSVSRVEFKEIDQTIPPTETPPAAAEDQVTDFVTAFMDARLEDGGSGAVAYLSTQAHMAYVTGERLWDPNEKGLSLYAFPHPQGDPTVTYVGFRIQSVGRADAQTCGWFPEGACQDAWEVVVVTDLEPVGDGPPGTMQETLMVAPADGAAAEFADWMISGAARGAEPPDQR